eukprot:CAMPEP_0181288068 /NCGR_PEP_ID=MMETSP1101-20121128/129_1 /TAXON_ID=46948 /ORGANISM="Rhodomonas abbreviata, Strain Caron Lab Isolate" /LENGTH=392 /DNA_ID=CAMNT_0023392153 /DNA_START=61 /DNA_END=1236 /DNA_ORIENTATION=+
MVLGALSCTLTAVLATTSYYYHVCDVDYRVELSDSCIPKFQEQKLEKYKFPHIGWKPDLFPPKTEGAWYETKPFLASDGKTVLQSFSSLPANLGGKRASVRELCLRKGWRSDEDLKRDLERCPTLDPVAGSPKAVCILLAGLGDSIMRNGHLADILACKGFSAHGFDYPGWGMSQKQAGLGSECIPGLVYDWGKQICGEVIHFTNLLKKAYPPETKFFVCAASIGGATALRSCITNPDMFDGAVLLCPAIQSDVQPFLQAIAPILGRIFPRLYIGGLGDDDIGSRNLVGAWEILHDKGKSNVPLLAATGAAIIDHLRFLKNNLHNMKVPFLAMHGERDLIIDPAGTKLLMEKASSSDKSVRWYEEAWHDLLFEPEWEDIIGGTVQWMEARLG